MAQDKNTKKTKKSTNLPGIVDNFFLPVLILLAVAVFMGGYMYLLKQAYTDLVTVQQKRLNQVEKTIEDLKKQEQDLDKLKTAGISFDQSEKELLNAALPDEYDFASIVIQLTYLAEEYGFTVTSLEIEPAKPAKNEDNQITLPAGVKAVDISLEAQGVDYLGWKRLVSALEGSAMIIDVKAVNMVVEEGTYSLELTSYYYPKS